MSYEMKHSGESFSLESNSKGKSYPTKWNTQGNPDPCSETRLRSNDLKQFKDTWSENFEIFLYMTKL